jgi:glycosyltransferase involved in cell wall biosynthesis
MAMGMPVVTNSVGAEGLDVKNGEELFIEDDPKRMAEIIKRLLHDPSLRETIGMKGQAFVRRFHNWETVYGTFGEMGL